MSKLFLITGPCGIGKSTISKELAFNLKKSVLIEGDDIYHQVIGSYHSPWDNDNHLNTFWKVSTNIIKTYLDEGYDVVFNYIIKKEDYYLIKDKIKNADIILTVLLSSIDTLLKRDKSRDEDYRMNERCIVLLEKFLKEDYDQKDTLYTDNLTIKETTDIILQKGAQNE